MVNLLTEENLLYVNGHSIATRRPVPLGSKKKGGVNFAALCILPLFNIVCKYYSVLNTLVLLEGGRL